VSDRFSVIVSVGTYHLPFERLGNWIASWTEQHPEAFVEVQHGVSTPVPGATNHTMLPHPEPLQRYRDASAVVLQGGAGGVMDARLLGLVPIVVPRLPELGEVVDRHQVEFADELARLGLVHVAGSKERLYELLDAARAGTLTTRTIAGRQTDGTTAVLAALTAPFPARRRSSLVPRILVSARAGRPRTRRRGR